MKRAFDVSVAVTLVIVLFPLMAMIALAVWADGSGPILYRGIRVGRRGAPFQMLKFRTMVPASKTSREITVHGDPRITRIGLVLRATKLDELPQLVNVLRGDMSLVGPRPIVPEEVRKYGRHFHTYAIARPGITGMWQTNGRNSVRYSARVARDRHYARHWSLRLDLFLLLKTIPAILKFDQTA
jgi:lipopolysaccharide/colanic/teichoic acid biosynthesis glycosyltransferase